jgi:peptide/nickel transport system permease protein
LTRRELWSRLARVPLVLCAVTALVFSLLRMLPGDPALNVAGTSATAEQIEQVRRDLNLDASIPAQYGTWVANVVGGDLGQSYFFNSSVTDLISSRIGVSIRLMVYSMALGLAVAIPLGLLAGFRASSRLDRAASAAVTALQASPNYVIGIVLVAVFAVRLDWLPALYDDVGVFSDPWGHVKSVAMPVAALAAGQIAVYMRLLRSDVIGTMQADFVAVARSKGISPMRLAVRHVLPSSGFSVLTSAGVNIGALIGSTVIVERIFDIPGMGSLTAEAIVKRDFQTVQGCVIVFALIFVVATFAIDVIYGLLDPRIRHGRS